MSDNYKFEMLRYDEAAEINTSLSVKTRGVMASEVVSVFAEFLQACGFHSRTVAEAFLAKCDELSNV